MSNCVALYQSLETPVSWRTDVSPCFVLTAGMNNKVNISFHESPNSKDNPAVPAGGISMRIFDIPVFHAVTEDPIVASITEGATSVELSIAIPDELPRGYYRAQVERYVGSVDNIEAIYHCWVIVDKQRNPRPDTYMDINSIRSQFADVCALDNKMLESLEVSAGDIASAVCRCLEQWRDTAPRV